VSDLSNVNRRFPQEFLAGRDGVAKFLFDSEQLRLNANNGGRPFIDLIMPKANPRQLLTKNCLAIKLRICR
jgi:hypothetical protein